MKWLVWFVLLALVRLVQLCWLYFAGAPIGGGPYVDRWYRFLPHAFVADLGVVATAALLFLLLSRPAERRPAAKRVLVVAAGVFACVHCWFSGGDDELMRWMGQHLSVSFFSTYGGAASDPALFARIYSAGFWHFTLSIALATAATVASALLLRRPFRDDGRPGRVVAVALLALAVAGLTSPKWFGPSRMRWKRIAPPAWNFAGELTYSFSHRTRPADWRAGIEFLGGDPDAEFPFWREEPDEAASLEAFRARPLDERPDVVLLTIESLRGWSGDVRDSASCARLPNVCALAKRGTFFPRTFSVGYPSVEGLLGLQLGVWSHPEKTFLSDRSGIATRSLPEILRDAGYASFVLTATEPSFDNLVPHFRKWFDGFEYDPANQNDVPIARRFAELYRSRDPERPLYFDWMSTTTHIPFAMPKEFGPQGDDMNERYLQVLAHMDTAVGMVLDEIARGPRAERTLVVLTGDHSTPTKDQAYGTSAHPGLLWVPMIVAGPGIPAGAVDGRNVSHADLAPTVLKLLGLKASNHFTGTDLFAGDSVPRRVLAFRHGDALFADDSVVSLFSPDEDRLVSEKLVPGEGWNRADVAEGFVRGEPAEAEPGLRERIRAAMGAWEWVVDRDLLMPAPK